MVLQITKQICTQDLHGENAGAGGIGERVGNCSMHLLNSQRNGNNLFFPDPSAAIISPRACLSLSDNHLAALYNGPGFESIAVQRSQDDSS